MADTPYWVPIVSAGLGAAATWVVSQANARAGRGSRIESEARVERFDTYRRLVALLLKTDEATEMSKKHLAIDIALFASDDVACAWIAFLDAALDGSATDDSPEALGLWSRIILAIRRDSSRPHTKLSKADILAVLGIRKGRDPLLARQAAFAAGLAKDPTHPQKSKR